MAKGWVRQEGKRDAPLTPQQIVCHYSSLSTSARCMSKLWKLRIICQTRRTILKRIKTKFPNMEKSSTPTTLFHRACRRFRERDVSKDSPMHLIKPIAEVKSSPWFEYLSGPPNGRTDGQAFLGQYQLYFWCTLENNLERPTFLFGFWKPCFQY